MLVVNKKQAGRDVQLPHVEHAGNNFVNTAISLAPDKTTWVASQAILNVGAIKAVPSKL